MKNTYWNNKGTHQQVADLLQEMVPTMGPVYNVADDEESGIDAAVDHFRQAANAYYDIFNNAGCNSVSRKISKYFPGVMQHLRGKYNYRNPNWDLIESLVEPMMDKHVLKAAKAKNIK